MTDDNTPATKQDLAEVRTDLIALRTDFTELRTDFTELRTDFGELRTDVTALRTDFGELRTEFTELRRFVEKSAVAERAHTDQRLAQLSDQLTEAMRDMQTEVLRAFHGWARPAEIKIRSHEERLTLLEERVSGLERGDLPPSSMRK